MQDAKFAKDQARQRARLVRARLAETQEVGGFVANFLKAVEVDEGEVVAGYWPHQSELDVRPLLEVLSSKGIACALPVVVSKDAALHFRSWKPGDELAEGSYGIPAPLETATKAVAPDVVIVPLLAFDERRFRLGYGGGFYDRTIVELRKNNPSLLTVGAAFSGQCVKQVPIEEHDQPLDLIVTEEEIIGLSA